MPAHCQPVRENSQTFEKWRWRGHFAIVTNRHINVKSDGIFRTRRVEAASIRLYSHETQRITGMPAKASLAEAVAVDESSAAETPASCKERVVTAVTGIAVFAGLINGTALSVLACPRDGARSRRSWPEPLATGRPEDTVWSWSGHRHWSEPDFLARKADQPNTWPGQRH
jgi:hypothetical protein